MTMISTDIHMTIEQIIKCLCICFTAKTYNLLSFIVTCRHHGRLSRCSQSVDAWIVMIDSFYTWFDNLSSDLCTRIIVCHVRHSKIVYGGSYSEIIQCEYHWEVNCELEDSWVIILLMIMTVLTLTLHASLMKHNKKPLMLLEIYQKSIN